MKLVFLFLFFAFSFGFRGFSQGLSDDSASINQKIKQSIQLYDNYMGAQSAIFNGPDYLPLNFKKEGIPFFEVDSMATGWVGYEGRIYEPMHIQYDVARNHVVILNYDKRGRIILNNELVDSFQLLNHRFLRLQANSAQNLGTTGFYDLLYNGKTKVLASRKKAFREVIKDNEVIRVFVKQDRHFVFKGDKYYLVNNKKDVFRLFDDKKHEIKAAMRQQKIKFRRSNFEEALLMAAKIYDQH